MAFKISELKSPGIGRIEVTATVTQISEPRLVTTRRGEQMRVATARIKDDSGEMDLSLWNEDIDRVKVGSVVKIENGYTSSFRGEIQLSVGRYGKLTVE